MVEQLTLNQLVPGSSPGGATRFRFFPVKSWLKRSALRRRSSMVEHLFCKQAVAGSNPIAGSIFLLSASLFSPPRVPTPAIINYLLPDCVMVAQATLTRFV